MRRSQRASPFHCGHFPKGHAPTDYARWWEEGQCYRVQYEEYYEPSPPPHPPAHAHIPPLPLATAPRHTHARAHVHTHTLTHTHAHMHAHVHTLTHHFVRRIPATPGTTYYPAVPRGGLA
jgi:hypothetical protein